MWLLKQLFMESVWHQLQELSTTFNNALYPRRLRKTQWIINTDNAFQNDVFPCFSITIGTCPFVSLVLAFTKKNGTFMMQYLSDRRWTLSSYVDVPLATAQQGAVEELRRWSCSWAIWNASDQANIGDLEFDCSIGLIDKKKMFGPDDFGRNDQPVSGSGVGMVCTIGIGWDHTSCNLEVFFWQAIPAPVGIRRTYIYI